MNRPLKYQNSSCKECYKDKKINYDFKYYYLPLYQHKITLISLTFCIFFSVALSRPTTLKIYDSFYKQLFYLAIKSLEPIQVQPMKFLVFSNQISYFSIF